MFGKSVVAGVLLVVLLGVLLVVIGRHEDQEQREWREFSAKHHCTVVPSKWYEPNRWQCDGFQVEHP